MNSPGELANSRGELCVRANVYEIGENSSKCLDHGRTDVRTDANFRNRAELRAKI